VVIDAHRLLSAMIDVLSSAGWLMPALACMEMSQMVIQGMWDSVSPLCILPHFTPDLLARAEEMGVESILDLPELQPPQQELLFQGLSADQVAEIAETCNRYPNVDLTFTPLPDQLTAGQQVSLHCNIVRDLDEDEEIPTVYSPRFPVARASEGWWLVLGDMKDGSLLAIKRFVLQRQMRSKLEFTAPSTPGEHTLKLFLMCDCYPGCDLDFDVSMSVQSE
jgi:pre-mRNA-splicing helicase BRR2